MSEELNNTSNEAIPKVTGIGGIFFFAENPELGKKLQRQHIASYLGIHRNILTRFLYKI